MGLEPRHANRMAVKVRQPGGPLVEQREARLSARSTHLVETKIGPVTEPGHLAAATLFLPGRPLRVHSDVAAACFSFFPCAPNRGWSCEWRVPARRFGVSA